MKNLNTLFLLFLGGCIGTDIENQIEPVLRISESTKSMRTTESFNFMSEYTNELAQVTSVAIIWDSSDPTIISIDQNGDATALNEGEAVISVQFDGFEDSITVDVLESKEAITISDFVSMIVVGSSFQFDVVYLDLNGQAKEPEIVSWISSVPSILSVDQEGVVFALASGTAEISVEFGNLMHALEVQTT
ncbi:MAG: hypothetical protein NWS46_10690 [Cyclobacteriaceae bacterium]|nr:hypothetical protein [Cyclobacteriaceae bacterium]